MKKTRHIFFGGLAILLVCGLFFSCNTGSEGSPGEGEIIETDDSIRSNLSRETNPQLNAGELEGLVAGNTAFALELYAQARDGAENVFFSPHSISVALAMAYAGARGNTGLEMARTLHFTLPNDRLHNAFNALDVALANRNEGTEEDEFRLHICNAAWGQKGYHFMQSYLDVLAVNYGSGLRLLDFMADPENCRITINDWVSDQTEERIEDLIPPGSISSDSRLVLTNAIYFKAGWLYPFAKEYTGEKSFFTLDGQEVKVQMMSQSERLAYTEAQNFFQAVELPYKGEEVSMVILLPAAGRFEKFEASLDSDFLNKVLENLTLKNVDLQMPRFTFEWEESLSELLKTMGMTDAFKPGTADFSGIDGSHDLFISGVLHKAFVSVDEAGTEAAGATAVVIGATSDPPPTVTVTVDRPFIFLIRHRATRAILFLGRLLDP